MLTMLVTLLLAAPTERTCEVLVSHPPVTVCTETICLQPDVCGVVKRMSRTSTEEWRMVCDEKGANCKRDPPAPSVWVLMAGGRPAVFYGTRSECEDAISYRPHVDRWDCIEIRQGGVSAGPTDPSGPPGPLGATGPTGVEGSGCTHSSPLGFLAWKSDATYAVGDIVYHGPGWHYWICTAPVSSPTPPPKDSSHWTEYLVRCGEAGAGRPSAAKEPKPGGTGERR